MAKIRIPQLKSFCCCCSLLTGCKVVGFLKLVLDSLLAVLFLYDALYASHIVTTILIMYGGNCTMEVCFSLVLLKGIFKRKASYIKVWVLLEFAMLMQSLFTLFPVVLSLVIAYSTDHYYMELVETIIQQFLLSGLDAYATLTVYSYYRDEYYRDGQGNIIDNGFIESVT